MFNYRTVHYPPSSLSWLRRPHPQFTQQPQQVVRFIQNTDRICTSCIFRNLGYNKIMHLSTEAFSRLTSLQKLLVLPEF